ncbi:MULTISPECIES: dihydroneopterin aldolase [Pseudomonas]|uniref:7,8-dihydroneopterin aldolase n=1 Tax=Pseudomonas neustonica TaxID=2487346 RepID=A0ABX9XKQ9_9PSED|nr:MULTISPECIES: dihydroneopterin aldolase [Pseudomonas]MAB23632.1 dihydroneopterin aldolase [Pseudomonadales bacterium]MBA6418473.1 dihydroneopterin aldolase [Pseudomonas sp. 5Ae-yellow]ROZ85738.1 dihydroneopterin aldolase [Pseudomonas sp. SSM44]ROZ87370.1 dihydroneopterin aldolase [Pseudomonas neustonica]
MDQVFIKGLTTDAVIGIYDWERTIRQPLIFDLDMAWDIRPAAAHENIDATLNYAAISEFIITFVQASEFLLVETLAEKLAAKLRKEFDIPWLRLRVTKPDAVKQAAGGVGVLIERGVLPS